MRQAGSKYGRQSLAGSGLAFVSSCSLRSRYSSVHLSALIAPEALRKRRVSRMTLESIADATMSVPAAALSIRFLDELR